MLKTIKLIDGNFPTINSELFSEKKRIGIMKSHIENYGLALLKSEIIENNKIIQLDNNVKIKVI